MVNHWGGVPYALHGKLVAARDEMRHDVPLTHLDPVLGFRSVLCPTSLSPDEPPPPHTLMHAFRDAGYRTVVLGATGLPRTLPDGRSRTTEVHDPREALRPWGIDRCSVYDETMTTPGRAAVHDEGVVREAREVLDTRLPGQKVLLVLNLLSCRDVARVRFRPKQGPSTLPSCTGNAPASFDGRRVPPNVGAPKDDLWDAFSTADAKAHGEALVDTTPAEYVHLLDLATETLRKVDHAVTKLVVDVLDKGVVATTATHSLALGEHRVRTGTAPLRTCATTFWACSRPTASDAPGTPLPFLVRSLATACGCRVTPRTPDRACLGTWATGGGVVARVVVTLRDHTYACVAYWQRVGDGAPLPALTSLHAVFEDPDDLHDLWPDLEHLHAELLGAVHDALPYAVHLPVTEPPPAVPSAPPPPNKASKAVVPPTPSRMPPKGISLRQKELRLNTMHR